MLLSFFETYCIFSETGNLKDETLTVIAVSFWDGSF
jgi:hypothetical protein